MDRKGEPQTLEQQSELRLYTDYPLKPVSQNFPNLWFLIIWKLTSCQFPKAKVESHPVKEYTGGRILQNGGDIFWQFHEQE